MSSKCNAWNCSKCNAWNCSGISGGSGVSNNCTNSGCLGRHVSEFEEAESMSLNILLRTVFLQVPIIPSLVGGVGGWRSGLGIGKSKETLASAYVLRPLKTSVVSIYERLEE